MRKIDFQGGKIVVARSPTISLFAFITVLLTVAPIALSLFVGKANDVVILLLLASPLWGGVVLSVAGASCFVRDSTVRSCLPGSDWIRLASPMSIDVKVEGSSLFLMGLAEDDSEHRLVSVSGWFDGAGAAVELELVKEFLNAKRASEGHP